MNINLYYIAITTQIIDSQPCKIMYCTQHCGLFITQNKINLWELKGERGGGTVTFTITDPFSKGNRTF